MALGNGGLGSGGVLDSILHPDLLNSLYRVYPSVCNIQVSTETKRPNGEIVNEWSDHSGLTGLRGILTQAKQSDEQRGTALTVQTATHVLDFQGYHPDIIVTHRAVVQTAVSNGLSVTFNILTVAHDSQSQQTRLELEEVNH